MGGAVDYGTQVVKNLLDGNKFVGESFSDVSWGSVLVSATSGAISGGLSALAPKSFLAKAGVEALNLTRLGAESASKQYLENKSVDLMQTVSDVGASRLGDFLTAKVAPISGEGASKAMAITNRQLDRAVRIANNDVTSSGRAATVEGLKSNIKALEGTQKAIGMANETIKNLAGGTFGNTLQETSNAFRSGPKIVNSPLKVNADNTRINKVNFLNIIK